MSWILILFAYLLGSVPCGLLLGSLAGVDIRKGGSGNIGATNVTRQLGKAFGLLTLVGDAAKAVIPMMLSRRLLETDDLTVVVGMAAFVGHCFPVYLRFRGGKGVATALGMWLYLVPAAAGLLLLVFIGTVLVTGFVSAGSLAAAALLPVVLFLLHAPRLHIVVAIGITVIIWFKHRDNIGRLLQGTEKSWRRPGEVAEENK